MGASAASVVGGVLGGIAIIGTFVLLILWLALRRPVPGGSSRRHGDPEKFSPSGPASPTAVLVEGHRKNGPGRTTWERAEEDLRAVTTPEPLKGHKPQRPGPYPLGYGKKGSSELANAGSHYGPPQGALYVPPAYPQKGRRVSVHGLPIEIEDEPHAASPPPFQNFLRRTLTMFSFRTTKSNNNSQISTGSDSGARMHVTAGATGPGLQTIPQGQEMQMHSLGQAMASVPPGQPSQRHPTHVSSSAPTAEIARPEAPQGLRPRRNSYLREGRDGAGSPLPQKLFIPSPSHRPAPTQPRSAWPEKRSSRNLGVPATPGGPGAGDGVALSTAISPQAMSAPPVKWNQQVGAFAVPDASASPRQQPAHTRPRRDSSADQSGSPRKVRGPRARPNGSRDSSASRTPHTSSSSAGPSSSSSGGGMGVHWVRQEPAAGPSRQNSMLPHAHQDPKRATTSTRASEAMEAISTPYMRERYSDAHNAYSQRQQVQQWRQSDAFSLAESMASTETGPPAAYLSRGPYRGRTGSQGSDGSRMLLINQRRPSEGSDGSQRSNHPPIAYERSRRPRGARASRSSDEGASASASASEPDSAGSRPPISYRGGSFDTSNAARGKRYSRGGSSSDRGGHGSASDSSSRPPVSYRSERRPRGARRPSGSSREHGHGAPLGSGSEVEPDSDASAASRQAYGSALPESVPGRSTPVGGRPLPRPRRSFSAERGSGWEGRKSHCEV